jgi:hypothetical protein
LVFHRILFYKGFCLFRILFYKGFCLFRILFYKGFCLFRILFYKGFCLFRILFYKGFCLFRILFYKGFCLFRILFYNVFSLYRIPFYNGFCFDRFHYINKQTSMFKDVVGWIEMKLTKWQCIIMWIIQSCSFFVFCCPKCDLLIQVWLYFFSDWSQVWTHTILIGIFFNRFIKAHC